jgi:hypothetical protein
MILTVTCNICKTVLVIIEKETITQEDCDLYKSICSCDEDGQQDIQYSISEGQ